MSDLTHGQRAHYEREFIRSLEVDVVGVPLPGVNLNELQRYDDRVDQWAAEREFLLRKYAYERHLADEAMPRFGRQVRSEH